jgi:hypothetical protein
VGPGRPEGPGRIPWRANRLRHRGAAKSLAGRRPADRRAAGAGGGPPALARHVYYTGECAFAIDEILGIATDSRPLKWVDTCQTEGRELGITMIVATQRPARIPLVLVSEADAFLVFYLALEKDRDRLAEIIGPYTNPGYRTFRPVYYAHGLTAAVECAPLPFVK